MYFLDKFSLVNSTITASEEETIVLPNCDPANWIIDSKCIDYFILNQPIQDVTKINFNSTVRKCGKYYRKLPHSIFTRPLHNGQTATRKWLLYSSSLNVLFFFQCLLFFKQKMSSWKFKIWI